MKKLIIMTVMAACIALCAAVWPQGKAVRETSAPDPAPAVSARSRPLRNPEQKLQPHHRQRKKR